jgi:hypothetical protein
MSEIIRWVKNALDIRPAVQEPVKWVHYSPAPERNLGVVQRIPTEVDLIRVCSVVDEYCASRYVFRQGIWKYGGPVIVDEHVWENAYRNKNEYVVSWNDLVAERCPLCGITGTVVKCAVCKFICCRGRTTADGFFRCRQACGGSGYITRSSFTNRGIAL